MNEITSTKNLFDSRQIVVSPDWLDSCIRWCKEEILPPNYTTKDLQRKVFEQWLLLDLRDLQVPSLPPQLAQKQKYSLDGNYSLQLLFIVDISKPKHWQLQRLRNDTTDKNIDPDISFSNRMLQLRLTDGVQEVEGIEYKPISILNLNLTPGVKIRLLGPIIVRRGQLLLQNHNVKIIGGEVDTLIVPNSAENTLAKHFNLPLNDNPRVIQENILKCDTNITHGNTVNRNIPIKSNPRKLTDKRVNNVNQGNNKQQKLNDNDEIMMEIEREFENAQMNISLEEIPYINIEEERINKEIETLMEIESEFQNPKSNVKNISRTPDIFEDNELDDCVFENIQIPTNTVINPQTNSSQLDDDLFKNIDIGSHYKDLGNECIVPKKLIVWPIKKLAESMTHITKGKFKINAKFKTVVEKLTTVDEKFHLVIKVEDESGDIVIAVHSDIVSNLTRCEPSAFMQMRDKTKRTADVEKKVLDALRNLRAALLELNNLMEVQVVAHEKFPCILRIL